MPNRNTRHGVQLREAQVRDPVCKWYAENGGALHVRNVFRPGPAVGFPDDTFYFYGTAVHIEFKGSKGRVSRKQEDKIARLRDAGQYVLIIDNVEEGIAALETLMEGHRPTTADVLEKIASERAGTEYRGLVTQCRKVEAW